ncbi:unnamed protein product [Symbiodinium microadriaticum]|nr:unnamed protein product [Symbiodinium microadriaticum]
MGGEDGSQTHNRYTTAVQDEFDIDDASMDAASQSETYILKKPANYSRKWGFIAGTPVPVTIEKIVDAGERSKFKVTFHLTQANQRKFYFPYKDGEVPIRYTGKVEDKEEHMSYQEVENMKAQDLEGGGAAAGGDPMGGMGGGDPMGGGAPPMGGAPGGKKNPYRVPQLDEMNLADPTNDAQQQGDDKVPLMQQSSYDAKNAAQNALQMAAEYDAHPEGKQLATVLKTISSSYNRIEGQWKQAANMAGTYEQQAKQNALNNQRQAAQNGTNPAQSAANAISSVGNKVAGIISQGGALSASASSATR